MKIVSLLYTNFVNDNRVQKMAMALHHAGHEIEIVALLEGDLKEKETSQGIPVTRIKTKQKSKSKISKALGFLSFSFKAARRYRKADVWHCNDIEAFMVGMLAKTMRPRLQLVYDAHELESERNHIKKWVGRMFFLYEKIFTRFAHTVITVSPSIQQFYRQHFRIRNDEIIYNCPHLVEFKPTDKLREEFNIGQDRIVFLYTGVLIGGRGLETLLEVFSHIDPDKYHVVFMGNGKLKSKILEYAAKHKNIHVKDAVPYTEILSYANSADYGFQSGEPVCLSYVYSLPNKLFDYIHAELPIICNNLRDCKNFVEEHRIGYGLEKLDLENMITLLPKLSVNDKKEMQARFRELKRQYNWQEEEKKLLAVYDKIKIRGKK